MKYENSYIIKYGSYGDGDQGFIGPFETEEDAENWWEENKTLSDWKMVIEELLHPKDPERESVKFHRDYGK